MDLSSTQQAVIEVALFFMAYGFVLRFKPDKKDFIARVAISAAVFTALVLAYIQLLGAGLDQFILLTIFSYFIVGVVAALVFELIRLAYKYVRNRATD